MLRYSGRNHISKDPVLYKRDFALLAAFPVEGRPGLAWMIHVIIYADAVSEDLLAESTREVASSFLVLSHSKIGTIAGGCGYSEEEQHLAPCIRIDNNIELSRSDICLVLVHLGSFKCCLGDLVRVQLANISKCRQGVSGLVTVVSVHCQ